MESTNIKIAPSATGKIRSPHKAAELFNAITAQLTQQVLNLEEQTVDLGERAVFFRVCEMMIRRWIAAGVDVLNPLAIAHHLAASKNPSSNAISRLLEELNQPDFL